MSERMTDLERARWLLPDGTDEVEVRELAGVIAAARREGAEAEREKVAMWMIERSIPTGHGDTVEDLLAEMRAAVAEEMRERAARLCEGGYTTGSTASTLKAVAKAIRELKDKRDA